MLSLVPDFKEDARDFPVGPVAKKDVVPSMQGGGPGSIPGDRKSVV